MKISPISGNIHKVDLFGHFDARIASDFVNRVDSLNTAMQSYVIVDLADVSFIDSAALAALMRGMKHYRQSQGELYIVNLQMPVLIIFELTRLDRAFSIFPTAADALADIHAEDEVNE